MNATTVERRDEPQAAPERPEIQRVTVTNIDMTFWDIVTLMVKFVLATIPATIILALFGAAMWLGLAALLRGFL